MKLRLLQTHTNFRQVPQMTFLGPNSYLQPVVMKVLAQLGRGGAGL